MNGLVPGLLVRRNLMNSDEKQWEMIFEIECWIKNYMPPGWKETLGTAMFIPKFSPEDLPMLLQGVHPRLTLPMMIMALDSYLNQPKENKCKTCSYFTFEPEESPRGDVGRCGEFPMYVTKDFGCKLHQQDLGIRCGGFPRVNGKLYFGG
jgi:hypothetical protein